MYSYDISLMCCNVEVLRFNFNKPLFKVIVPELLPYGLRGVVHSIQDVNNDTYKIAINNERYITKWLSNRVLNLSRANAEKLYTALNVEHCSSDETRCKIALLCNAVSLHDNYWLRLKHGPQLWEDVNLRHNTLNNTISQIMLYGSSITVEGSITSPELTTDGSFPKAWRRLNDGSLWLYKRNSNNRCNAEIEVVCSNLLSKMNVEHVPYELVSEHGETMCRCKLISDDNVSLLSAHTLMLHCKYNNIPFVDLVMRVDKESIYKMCIVDYLIANPDRHSHNWGFLYDAKTMKLIKCHPLFDHNLAFDKSCLKDRNAIYKFNNKSMRDTALSAISEVDFYFKEEIRETDFLCKSDYEEFKSRADELRIQTKASNITSISSGIDLMFV